MRDRFFDRPILDSPYEYPSRHWELDETGIVKLPRVPVADNIPSSEMPTFRNPCPERGPQDAP